MRVLFAINEAAPLYKLGGLGDVGGSLPIALAASNPSLDIRLILPYHPEIKPPHGTVEYSRFTVTYARRQYQLTVYLTHLPHTQIPVYLLFEPELLSTSSGAMDSYADKYALFSLGVSAWVSRHSSHYQPQLIHCHDWHTALIPLILKHLEHNLTTKTLLTIHNLGYQGITHLPLGERLGLDSQTCQILSWDIQNHDINILMEGILHTNFITTVSPTYAKEIQTPEYGHLLDQILQQKSHQLKGILNGIDTEFFNPQSDPFLDTHYSKDSVVAGKQAAKTNLKLSLGLKSQPLPLIGFIGRIDPKQKGIDIITQYLAQKQSLPPHDFVFLGTGDPTWEAKLHQIAGQVDSVRIITRFDEPLAHRLYAASDFLLIPSRYEPCGLIQMIAMRYGTIPIAHQTGGLADTITPETGYLFKPCTLTEMLTSLQTALTDFNHTQKLALLRQNALNTDFSWTQSAPAYQKVYQHLINA